MTELVFATVFDTHMCRKKLTAPDILENRRFYVVVKKNQNCVR